MDEAIKREKKKISKGMDSLLKKDKVRDKGCDRDHALVQKIKKKTAQSPKRK
jgi:hypothetical protein